MKTQLLQLEPHDDLISTLDKMDWSQTGRLLLVWPDKGKVLNRRLDLMRLKRRSSQLGAQIALVSRDAEVIYQARRAGIPTYPSIKQAQNVHWRVDRRFRPTQILPASPTRRPKAELENELAEIHPSPPAWPQKPVSKIAVFLLGLLAVFTLFAALLPRATISVQPERKAETLQLTLSADPARDDVHLSGIVPAQAASVVVEGRETIEVSGKTIIPDRYATGRVVFTNLGDRGLEIPSGVILRTSGETAVRFETVHGGELAPGVGATLALPVKATAPGEAGNLAPNSLVIVEGPLGLSTAVNNPLPTSGGGGRPAALPSEVDREKLQASLLLDLQATALQELQNQLSLGDVLFTESITRTQIINSQFSPPPGLPSESLELELQVEFQAYYADNTDITRLVAQILNTNAADGYHPLLDTVSLREIANTNHSAVEPLSWRANVRYTSQADVQSEQVIAQITGLPLQEASARLQNSIPLEQAPVISLWPHNWFRLPLLPFRISVQVEG